MTHIGTRSVACIALVAFAVCAASVCRVLTVVLLAPPVASRVARGGLSPRRRVLVAVRLATIARCVLLGARPQALQLVHCLRDKRVRERQLRGHPLVCFPLNAFLSTNLKSACG